jgi:RHS repeat-associated protein
MGRHYNFNRDYNPVTGRYVQSDPLGLDGGMNAYNFTGKTPELGNQEIIQSVSSKEKDRHL